MKAWLLIVLLFAPIALAQGDDLEESLDQTLEEMQAEGDILNLNEKPVVSADPSIGGKEDGLFDRMIQKMKEKMVDQIKSNPLKSMSALEVRKFVLDRSEGTFIGDYLKESPRCMYFIVNVLRDEFAMPQMVDIFKREKDLKLYSYVVLGNLIFFFLLGWYYDRKSRGGLLSSLFRKIFFILLSTAISIAVFYMLFHKELKPTIAIAKEAIMKPMIGDGIPK